MNHNHNHNRNRNPNPNLTILHVPSRTLLCPHARDQAMCFGSTLINVRLFVVKVRIHEQQRKVSMGVNA